ncbi:DUF4870 domain-containing protein [Planococcus shixiaomingii]|uniref:DUF4870 domain-containing protein n=1 Tax=Planococcus shixiaomingii TaxID=3058393 RepID=UPI0026057AE8|nr:hypothetical protein [Planococcus sp. N022]WKA53831.1 hypothetical protein QWY21_14320 [Planococcus sp. N022]
MAENHLELFKDKPSSNFEKQTVFKGPEEHTNLKSSGMSLGLTENIVAAFAYLFGFVSGSIILLFERENRFVRFHALQSIYISIVFITLLSLFERIPVIGWMSGVILSSIGLVLWIILMLNAYDGKNSKIFFISELAENSSFNKFSKEIRNK